MPPLALAGEATTLRDNLSYRWYHSMIKIILPGLSGLILGLSVTLSVFACLQPLSMSKGLRRVTVYQTTLEARV